MLATTSTTCGPDESSTTRPVLSSSNRTSFIVSLRDQMMSCTKVARSTLLEPRFSPSNQIHSVHFENIGSRNRTAVTLCRRAQAARILKLELPMNYSDDSAAGG